jgi:catechol 2,3-dioxygenase-like lactoylglutathione lyase family enzyme
VSESLNSVGAITMFVEDRQRSKSFYEKVFDVAAIHEDEDAVAFKFENMIVNLLELRAADDLIDPGSVARGEAGSRFQLTIWVEDVDAVCAELEPRGITLLNGPMNREWGVRTASFTDPDGHIWEVAANIPS